MVMYCTDTTHVGWKDGHIACCVGVGRSELQETGIADDDGARPMVPLLANCLAVGARRRKHRSLSAWPNTIFQSQLAAQRMCQNIIPLQNEVNVK